MKADHPSRIVLVVAAVILLLTSCDPNRVYEKNVKIPNSVWASDNIISFELPILDTISPHNLYVNIRNGSLYPMSNLYLFITTIAPSGHTIRDTVELILADDRGKWLGSGLGDMWDHQQLYKQNVRFAQSGTYRFDFEQAMRMEKLPFVIDVGLRIETAE